MQNKENKTNLPCRRMWLAPSGLVTVVIAIDHTHTEHTLDHRRDDIISLKYKVVEFYSSRYLLV